MYTIWTCTKIEKTYIYIYYTIQNDVFFPTWQALCSVSTWRPRDIPSHWNRPGFAVEIESKWFRDQRSRLTPKHWSFHIFSIFSSCILTLVWKPSSVETCWFDRHIFWWTAKELLEAGGKASSGPLATSRDLSRLHLLWLTAETSRCRSTWTILAPAS